MNRQETVRLSGRYGWGWRELRVLATLAALWILTSATAQNPNVQDEFYSGRLRQQGDTLTFCSWNWSATQEFDSVLAQEVADVLLLDIEIRFIEQSVEVTGEEMLQWLFILLSDECDLAMGFNLNTGIYPTWLTPSRSYLDAPYVTVVKDTDYGNLSDVPRGSLIGSQIYTQLDNLLVISLRALGPEAGWRRLPYDDPQMLVNHVAQGYIEAGIMWGPRYSALQSSGNIPDGVTAVPLTHALAETTEQVGALAFARNSWIISEFDAAINALIDSGRIAELIEMYGIYANVPTGR